MLSYNNERGFTILESMLAIVIIGLMAIIAIPRLVSTDRRVVYIAYHQIAADMRYARSLAITNAEDYKVVFYEDPDDPTYYDRYSIIKASDGSEAKSMSISDQVYCAIPGGGATWEITFTRLGSASPSGDDIITLTLGEYVETISVVPATGRVS